MKTTSILLPTLLLAALSARGGTTLESGEFAMDLRESPRVSAGTETLTYSTRWAGAVALAGCTRKARLAVAGYAGAEELADVPVLVRLSTAIQGFDYDDFVDPVTGADLVFCDESETTVYPHEIDEWNTNGESLVWVRLPGLAAGTTFKMGYGGTPAAVADVNASAHAVWSDYAGVWHMNEDSGTAFDSTANGLDAVPTAGANATAETLAQMVACENGACGRARINATTDVLKGNLMQAPSYDALGLDDFFSVSTWIRGEIPQNYPRVITRKRDSSAAGGFEVEVTNLGMFKVRGGSSAAIELPLPDFDDRWLHLFVSFNGQTVDCFTNGALCGHSEGVVVAPSDNGIPLSFGNKDAGEAPSFLGQYDEIRLRGGSLSAARIRADYDMVANPGFVTCGAVEPAVPVSAEIRLNGEVFAGSLSGEGTVNWTPSAPGIYQFEHVSSLGDATVSIETATFVVPGPADEELSLVAEGDLIEGVSIRIGDVPDGWTIHYTTDGSEPTASSQVYTVPFALAQSATVKVLAVSDEFGWTTGVAQQRFDLASPLAVAGATARQRYPWNGLVDVDFSLAGDSARRYRVTLDATDLDGRTNLSAKTVWADQGLVTNAAIDLASDAHRLVWNAAADLPESFIAERMSLDIRVESIHDTALYLVVDLSGGPDAERYPVSYLPDIPEGGWTEEYKTTKLVLRRIGAGTFTMGSPSDEIGRGTTYPLHESQHSVTLTHPFYIGVFEVTQKQWELVMGLNRSSYTGETRPVEQVSYEDIRGSSNGAGWPTSSAVDATSFMGKLRARTGLEAFDLPTEAQWEYSCRAGTKTALNSGMNLTNISSDASMAAVGRYTYNTSDGKGGYSEHAAVGSYLPNAWGLYDMHGNVWEWCLDWFASSLGTSSVTDPVGASSGSFRVDRGGCWGDLARGCRSASCHHLNSPSSRVNHVGFRLFLHDASAVVEAPIVAPAGLTATTNRAGDVMLSWEPVSGAYAYQIRRSKTGAFVDGTWLNTVTNTTYVDWTAESRADYVYWVRAQFESGRVGQWSEAAEGCRYKGYTVHFDENGGTGTMADIECFFDQPCALPTNAFANGSLVFAGWATNATGTCVYADGETVENLTFEPGETVVLYAVWASSSYTVKFNKSASAASGTMADQTIARNASATLRANAFVRAGYRFAGWATSASGAKVYDDKQSVQNITTGSSVTLYAVWEALTAQNALYMVIDLSGGANASSYPVTYLSAVPSGGWTDAYKTTKLVLRRIEPGTFTMGSPTSEPGRESWETQHKVTISKPFYIGVFEVTQKQYSLVMGSNPSYHKGDKKPVNGVSWNTLRGNANTYNWPSVGTVASGSFFGKVRSRIGLQIFDLPTEAQWEYACRAGTTTRYNNGSNARDGWKGLCSGWSDCPSNVGSYKVNNWGLYDMHGNVWEWCLDRSGNYPSSATTDPVGPTSGSIRICRGGSYNCGANNGWRSARRGPLEPEKNASNSYDYHGFRACLTIE